MNISIQIILEKMEQELQQAKSKTNESEIKPHLYAIKTLADLAFSDQKQKEGETLNIPKVNTVEPKVITTTVSEPLKIDDGANGDSIFDF